VLLAQAASSAQEIKPHSHIAALQHTAVSAAPAPGGLETNLHNSVTLVDLAAKHW
jgi:hypothetical protein